MIVDTKTFIWKTKDGRELNPTEMSDQHLINSIRMIRPKLEAALASRYNDKIAAAFGALSGFQGEMAQYAMEGEIDWLAKQGPGDWVKYMPPIIAVMMHELHRRGVDISEFTK